MNSNARSTSAITLTALLCAGLVLVACIDMSEYVADSSAGLNGSFETVESGLPVNWIVYTPRTVPDGDFDVSLDSEAYDLMSAAGVNMTHIDFFETVEGRPNGRGGSYHIDMLPTTCHVYFGSVTGATPDGRPAGRPFSEGISAVQGADRLGPTAMLRSAAKMDHRMTGGTLLNMKLTPALLEGDEGIEDILQLVRGYFRLGGHHIQFNVVDAAHRTGAKKVVASSSASVYG